VSAAWYGNELRGHRTVSGEEFNPDGKTVHINHYFSAHVLL
jgi:rare lipoprotein A (peptidoglycan hydrolase)